MPQTHLCGLLSSPPLRWSIWSFRPSGKDCYGPTSRVHYYGSLFLEWSPPQFYLKKCWRLLPICVLPAGISPRSGLMPLNRFYRQEALYKSSNTMQCEKYPYSKPFSPPWNFDIIPVTCAAWHRSAVPTEGNIVQRYITVGANYRPTWLLLIGVKRYCSFMKNSAEYIYI